jgi:hypothetical protein
MLENSQEVMKKVYDAAGVEQPPEGAGIEAIVGDDQRLAIYAEATKLRNSLKAHVAMLQKVTDSLEPEIVERFQSLGQQSVSLRGVTVYLAREVWPKVLDDGLSDGPDADAASAARDRLVEALSSDPQTDYLVRKSYNHQTLRGFLLNECEEDPDTMLPEIPEHLAGILGVSERYRARVLKK